MDKAVQDCTYALVIPLFYINALNKRLQAQMSLYIYKSLDKATVVVLVRCSIVCFIQAFFFFFFLMRFLS